MTPKILSICTGARLDRAAKALDGLVFAVSEYGIDNPARQAAFLANVGHESGGLHWSTEIWQPTDAQKRYEGRIDLGNTQPGDGYKFRGRGWFQITGRNNYRRIRNRLHERYGDDVPNFEVEPDALALPKWAAVSAADYWDDHKLNDYADAMNFQAVCGIINTGRPTTPITRINGYQQRLDLYAAAKEVLS